MRDMIGAVGDIVSTGPGLSIFCVNRGLCRNISIVLEMHPYDPLDETMPSQLRHTA